MLNNALSHVKVQHAITKQKCTEILQYCDNQFGSDGENQQLISNVRVSNENFIDKKEYKEEFFKHVRTINNVYKFNFDITAVEDLQFTRYFDGGEYKWHVDSHMAPYTSEASEYLQGTVRKFTGILLLNNPQDFVGGELELATGLPDDINYVKEISLDQGDMVVFPSFVPHRIKPIEKGCRKSIVVWGVGPLFK